MILEACFQMLIKVNKYADSEFLIYRDATYVFALINQNSRLKNSRTINFRNLTSMKVLISLTR